MLFVGFKPTGPTGAGDDGLSIHTSSSGLLTSLRHSRFILTTYRHHPVYPGDLATVPGAFERLIQRLWIISYCQFCRKDPLFVDFAY